MNIRVRKKLVPEEKPICNVVTVYRTRGNYLQRLEQFEKAIQSYNEALRWNSSDVPSLLGRSLARAKTTHYVGALADAVRAAQLEPDNLTALQIRAQTEYEKCAFERSMVLAVRGSNMRRSPPIFAEIARHAEQTVRECVGKSAGKVFTSIPLLRLAEKKRAVSFDEDAPTIPVRTRRMDTQKTHQVEMSRIEKQKADHMARVMTSRYLERMAHDKYFLKALTNDERLASANKKGSAMLKELADKALADVEKRQAVLRTRRPIYASSGLRGAALARISLQLARARRQHVTDAERMTRAAAQVFEKHDTAQCLQLAEFAIEQIQRKPINLLPGKDKFLQTLHDMVANAFLDQLRVKSEMSETDREKRAFILLGMIVSREPSRDSVLRVRPTQPLDTKKRMRTLERALTMSTRASERCYVLHELSRLYLDTKQNYRARFHATKCQTEARATNQRVWLLNAIFLLARCHLQQNNRPEARALLLEGAALSRSFRFSDVAKFFDTCVNVSLEGEVGTTEAVIEKREKAMLSLMQDPDLRSDAEHLFKRMSVVPVSRRFSIMPGARIETPEPTVGRRLSIMPRTQQPTTIRRKLNTPLGLQDFDL